MLIRDLDKVWPPGGYWSNQGRQRVVFLALSPMLLRQTADNMLLDIGQVSW